MRQVREIHDAHSREIAALWGVVREGAPPATRLPPLYGGGGGGDEALASAQAALGAKEAECDDLRRRLTALEARGGGERVGSPGYLRVPLHGGRDDGAQREAEMLEEEHAAAEEAYLRRWAGKQGRVTIVGTASYAHTLMRVRTMSEAALGKRVKAI